MEVEDKKQKEVLTPEDLKEYVDKRRSDTEEYRKFDDKTEFIREAKKGEVVPTFNKQADGGQKTVAQVMQEVVDDIKASLDEKNSVTIDDVREQVNLVDLMKRVEKNVKNGRYYETTNVGDAGEPIVEGASGERYIQGESKTVRECLEIEEEMKIETPWGAQMNLQPGAHLIINDYEEANIYGIQPEEFHATHEKIS